MSRLRAFLRGVREFRASVTTRHENIALRDAYDAGRELAHAATLRVFDESLP